MFDRGYKSFPSNALQDPVNKKKVLCILITRSAGIYIGFLQNSSLCPALCFSKLSKPIQPQRIIETSVEERLLKLVDAISVQSKKDFSEYLAENHIVLTQICLRYCV